MGANLRTLEASLLLICALALIGTLLYMPHRPYKPALPGLDLEVDVDRSLESWSQSPAPPIVLAWQQFRFATIQQLYKGWCRDFEMLGPLSSPLLTILLSLGVLLAVCAEIRLRVFYWNKLFGGHDANYGSDVTDSYVPKTAKRPKISKVYRFIQTMKEAQAIPFPSVLLGLMAPMFVSVAAVLLMPHPLSVATISPSSHPLVEFNSQAYRGNVTRQALELGIASNITLSTDEKSTTISLGDTTTSISVPLSKIASVFELAPDWPLLLGVRAFVFLTSILAIAASSQILLGDIEEAFLFRRFSNMLQLRKKVFAQSKCQVGKANFVSKVEECKSEIGGIDKSHSKQENDHSSNHEKGIDQRDSMLESTLKSRSSSRSRIAPSYKVKTKGTSHFEDQSNDIVGMDEQDYFNEESEYTIDFMSEGEDHSPFDSNEDFNVSRKASECPASKICNTESNFVPLKGVCDPDELLLKTRAQTQRNQLLSAARIRSNGNKDDEDFLPSYSTELRLRRLPGELLSRISDPIVINLGGQGVVRFLITIFSFMCPFAIEISQRTDSTRKTSQVTAVLPSVRSFVSILSALIPIVFPCQLPNHETFFPFPVPLAAPSRFALAVAAVVSLRVFSHLLPLAFSLLQNTFPPAEGLTTASLLALSMTLFLQHVVRRSVVPVIPYILSFAPSRQTLQGILIRLASLLDNYNSFIPSHVIFLIRHLASNLDVASNPNRLIYLPPTLVRPGRHMGSLLGILAPFAPLRDPVTSASLAIPCGTALVVYIAAMFLRHWYFAPSKKEDKRLREPAKKIQSEGVQPQNFKITSSLPLFLIFFLGVLLLLWPAAWIIVGQEPFSWLGRFLRSRSDVSPISSIAGLALSSSPQPLSGLRARDAVISLILALPRLFYRMLPSYIANLSITTRTLQLMEQTIQPLWERTRLFREGVASPTQLPNNSFFYLFLLGAPPRVILFLYCGLVLFFGILIIIPFSRKPSSSTPSASRSWLPSLPLIIIRKYYHFLATALLLPPLMFDLSFLSIALSGALSFLVLFEFIRVYRLPPIGIHIHRFMRGFVDARDAGPLFVTHIYLLLGCAIPVWLMLTLTPTLSSFTSEATLPLANFASAVSKVAQEHFMSLISDGNAKKSLHRATSEEAAVVADLVTSFDPHLMSSTLTMVAHADIFFVTLLPALTGALVLGVGDSAASLIGTLLANLHSEKEGGGCFRRVFRRLTSLKRWPGSPKTLGGTMAAFVAMMFSGWGVYELCRLFSFAPAAAIASMSVSSSLGFDGRGIELGTWSIIMFGLGIASIAVVLLEAWTEHIDNLFLPMIYFAMISLLVPAVPILGLVPVESMFY